MNDTTGVLYSTPSDEERYGVSRPLWLEFLGFLANLLLYTSLAACLPMSLHYLTTRSSSPFALPHLHDEYLALRGQLPNKAFFMEHIGGFCFGKSFEREPAGQIEVKLSRNTEGMWPQHSGVYVAFFDDQPTHWGAARKLWDGASVSAVMSKANAVQCLWCFPGERVDGVRVDVNSTMVISEKYRRHWHIVLVAMNMHPNITGGLTYTATPSLATNRFDAGDFNPETDGCPIAGVGDVVASIREFVH